jgi:hypothetical protein
MDAFKVHQSLIDDYRKFTEGFVDVRDKRIRESVREQSARGAQWPDPWLLLNPSFAGGGSVDELDDEGLLHPATSRIFRMGKDSPTSSTALTFHKHQRDTITVARSSASYALTTGTGSGKSLAYIVPIVDHVLRHGSGKGVKAIVVYPMNALREELKKFLRDGFGEGNEPATFERYTGRESDEDRARILDNPPDILLTNYVMLELVLTRPRERERLLGAARDLQFLVLDELNFIVYEQLPIFLPSTGDAVCAWDASSTVDEWLELRDLELNIALESAGFAWTEERRALIRFELDAAFFHLHEVAREDADYILDTFPIVQRKDIAGYGEYRTKRLILEVFDAMQKAIDTGTAYQTILDPPPGQGPRHAANEAEARL